MSDVLETGSRSEKDTYYISLDGDAMKGFTAKIEKINLNKLKGGVRVVRNAKLMTNDVGKEVRDVPKTTYLYKVVNAKPIGDHPP